MANPNMFFCVRHTPHIARELRSLPRTSRDRRALEELIETLSRASLVAADQLFGLVTRGHFRKDLPGYASSPGEHQ